MNYWTTNFTQSYENWNFDETSTTGFRHTKTNTCTFIVFQQEQLQRRLWTKLLNLTRRTETWQLLLPLHQGHLWHVFILANVKDTDEPKARKGKEKFTGSIPLTQCQATHIGETDRNLNTRLTEHIETSDEKW